jgi:hypothetical protein
MTFSITKGGGLPIALIAQLGCGGDIWKPVVDQLTGLQVITYDRPGTGNAPPRPAPNPPVPPSRGYGGCIRPHQGGLSWLHPRATFPHGWVMAA